MDKKFLEIKEVVYNIFIRVCKDNDLYGYFNNMMQKSRRTKDSVFSTTFKRWKNGECRDSTIYAFITEYINGFLATIDNGFRPNMFEIGQTTFNISCSVLFGKDKFQKDIIEKNGGGLTREEMEERVMQIIKKFYSKCRMQGESLRDFTLRTKDEIYRIVQQQIMVENGKDRV